METKKEKKTKGPKRMNKKFSIILIVIVIVVGAFGIYKYSYAKSHESTDNAQVDADITAVNPHVSGYIKKVFVVDNQMVKKGDTLVVIDDNEYFLRVKEAEAALAIAQSNLSVAQQNVNFSETQISTADATVVGAEASIEEAQIRVWRAQKDFDRYTNLLKDKVITEQQYEKALAEKQAAEKQLQIIQQNKVIATTRKGSSSSQARVVLSQINVAKATIAQREAILSEARLNLSYCVILAPTDGQVSTIPITTGQLVQAGQSLFNIVLIHKMWIIANFKETQITNMKVGQNVAIQIDAFPDEKFHGVINSMSPATGALFSILPPENATGNFVKIVQRVPVRIEIKENDLAKLEKLRPGLSADVEVTTK